MKKYLLCITCAVILLIASVFASSAADCSHVDTIVINNYAATEKKDGYTGDQICAKCGEIITAGEVIPAYGEVVIPPEVCRHLNVEIQGRILPSCKNTGYSGNRVCSDCGYVISYGSDLAKTNHSYDNGKVTKKATCTANGVYTYTCTVCNAKKSETLKSTGHVSSGVIEETETAATCYSEGVLNKVTRCLVCDTVLSKTTEVISKEEHTPMAAVTENAVAPTCVKDGSHDEVVYCIVCRNVLSKTNVTDEKLGHDIIGVEAEEVTCVDIGWDAYEKCARCDYSTYVEIPKLGHNPGDVMQENIIIGNCTTDSSFDAVTYCTRCSKELSRNTIIEKAPGHTPEITIQRKLPTCTQDGYTGEIVCSVCFETLQESETVEAKGHRFLDTIIPETCYTEGYTRHDCEECGYSVCDSFVPIAEHIVVIDAAVAPTCKSIGYTEGSHCKKCKTIFVDREILKIVPHSDENGDGVCDVCKLILSSDSACPCMCHSTGILQIFWKIRLFFAKIFGSLQVCECGVAHY